MLRFARLHLRSFRWLNSERIHAERPIIFALQIKLPIHNRRFEMKIRFPWIIALVSAFFVGQALAQESTTQTTTTESNGVTKTEVVHCVSGDSGRTYCGAAHTHYTITGTADPRCVEGKTWGLDERGIWVENGCVADFDPVISSSVAPGQVLSCTSTGDGRSYCHTIANHRYVLKTIRSGDCVEGKTWGIDKHGLWVSNGCSGDWDDND
jgi:hypothetical protein